MTVKKDDGVQKQYADDKNLNARIRLHQLYSTNKEGWSPWVFGQLEFPEGSRILELGCGNGQLWLDNRDAFPKDVHITMSDFSEGMVASAKERLTGFSGNVDFRLIDAQSIPFEDSVFDICIANHMLYHIPDINLALSEINRVLKPGGAFYATTVGERHLSEIGTILSGIDERISFHDPTQKKFTLQNGTRTLEAFFSNIRVRNYEDSLLVTDDEDLVQYILSSTGICNVTTIMNDELRERLRDTLKHQIARNGHVFVTKESGLFIARTV